MTAIASIVGVRRSPDGGPAPLDAPVNFYRIDIQLNVVIDPAVVTLGLRPEEVVYRGRGLTGICLLPRSGNFH